MKKTLFVFIMLASGIIARSQSQGVIALNVYGGYTFQDKVNLDAYHTIIQGGFQYGGGLEYFIQRNKSIELKYLRFDSKFPLYRNNGQQLNEGNEKGAENFVLFGGTNYFGGTGKKFTPYFGADLGVGWLSSPGGSSAGKFAWDAKLGVKIPTSGMVAFKLQAYIQSITSTFGYDYWLGYGGVYAVPSYATIFQFGLGGVVSFDFHKK